MKTVTLYSWGECNLWYTKKALIENGFSIEQATATTEVPIERRKKLSESQIREAFQFSVIDGVLEKKIEELFGEQEAER